MDLALFLDFEMSHPYRKQQGLFLAEEIALRAEAAVERAPVAPGANQKGRKKKHIAMW